MRASKLASYAQNVLFGRGCFLLFFNERFPEVERLAAELARLANTSKTEAIRIALPERRERTAALVTGSGREERLRHFLESCVWPTIPPEASRPWTREEEDAALGYGAWGEPA
jgi:antitoxin VapB